MSICLSSDEKTRANQLISTQSIVVCLFLFSSPFPVSPCQNKLSLSTGLCAYLRVCVRAIPVKVGDQVEGKNSVCKDPYL